MDATERTFWWCELCQEHHEHGEVGFRLPDAAFALTLPSFERERFREVKEADVAVVLDRSYFVRGVAHVPILGSDELHGIGFWAQISREDFTDFLARGRTKHPSYEGRIANQATFLGPTFGLACRVDFLAPGVRPSLVLYDETHPLARAQSKGVQQEAIDAWMAEAFHRGDPPPPVGDPFVARLATHGWEVTDPRDLGDEPYPLTSAPEIGDTVKVIVSFIASDHNGDPTRLRAGWWVELDDVSRSDAWSGLLANKPRVPAPLQLGSRIWLHPSHVIDAGR